MTMIQPQCLPVTGSFIFWRPLVQNQATTTPMSTSRTIPLTSVRLPRLVRGNVGLDDFSDEAARDPAVLAVAAKVRYRIDPNNPYPNNFTGHIRATLADGRVIEERQPHMRGGAHEPLTRADLEEKFALNTRHGGWDAARSQAALALIRTLYDGKIDLTPLRG